MKAGLIRANLAGTLFTIAALSVTGTPSSAADLPKSTQEMLKTLKLDAGILKDLDAAMALPKSMLDGSKKEGKVVIGGTYRPRDFRVMVAPFKERYPWIKIDYVRVNRYDRVIKTYIALKSGKVLFDVVMGFGGQAHFLEELNGLANISDMPVYKQIPKYVKSPGDHYVGMRILTRCFAYNTDKVKPEELPKTWDDIVTSKRWAGRNLALINRPNYWALHLWVTKGEAWTKDYLTKMFRLKPQLRKEAVSAAQQLLVAGEFDALIGGTLRHAAALKKKGAPSGFHCPDPIIPALATSIGVLKAGNVNSGKIFTNWFVSREGQVAQFAKAQYASIYPDLVDAGLSPLPELKLDNRKRVTYRDDLWHKEYEAMLKYWKTLWFSSQGLKMQTVKVKIDASKRGGRRYHFKVAGKEQKVRVSNSDTLVTVNGEQAPRKAVKKGMTCTITYPGNDQTAESVTCGK